MNRILIVAASTVLLAGRIHPSDAPRFAVEEKSSLAKTFESRTKLESSAFRIFVEGHDEPIHPPGDLHVSVESTDRIDVTDEYVAMGKGRPSKLSRTFDKLEATEIQHARSDEGGEDADEGGDHEKHRESALEGKTVLFTWNDDSESFAAHFPKDEGDAALLEDLVEDMDLRSLLPKGKVAEDESWDLDPKALDLVFNPGGDLKLKDEDGSDDSDDGIDKAIRKNMGGKAHGTWKGVSEEGGKKLGTIAITADLVSEGDVDSKGEIPGKTHFKLKLDLEGELVWDLAGGHFRSFHIGGKVELDTVASATIKMGDESAVMRQELDLEGETSYKASLR
jgi:hypothetical protein